MEGTEPFQDRLETLIPLEKALHIPTDLAQWLLTLVFPAFLGRGESLQGHMNCKTQNIGNASGL